MSDTRPDIAPSPLHPRDAAATMTPIAAYATANPLIIQYGCAYFLNEAGLADWLDEQHAINPRQTIHIWDLNRADGTWTLRTTAAACDLVPDIEPTPAAEQFTLLRAEGLRHNAMLREESGRYTLRVLDTNRLLGTYDTLEAVDDALIEITKD